MSQVRDNTQDRALQLLNAFKMEHMRSTATTRPPPDVQKRVSVRIVGIQKRARRQAEDAFARKDEDDNSGSDVRDIPLSAHDKKKVMRNKSAFISRRRQKNYVQLLEAFVQQSEMERDRELDQCVRNRVEVEQLRLQEQMLRDQLESISRSRLPALPAQQMLRSSGGLMCSTAQRIMPPVMSSSQLMPPVSQAPPPMVDMVSEIRGARPEQSHFAVGGPSQRYDDGAAPVRDPLSEILDDAIKEDRKWEF